MTATCSRRIGKIRRQALTLGEGLGLRGHQRRALGDERVAPPLCVSHCGERRLGGAECTFERIESCVARLCPRGSERFAHLACCARGRCFDLCRGVTSALRGHDVVVADRIVGDGRRVRVLGGTAHDARLAVDEAGREFARVARQAPTKEARYGGARTIVRCGRREIPGLGRGGLLAQRECTPSGRQAIAGDSDLPLDRGPRGGGIPRRCQVAVEIGEARREGRPEHIEFSEDPLGFEYAH